MRADAATMVAVATQEAGAAAAKETAPLFGKVDCGPFTFAAEDDATVYAAVEDALHDFEADPSVDAFSAIQHQLVALAGYPLVTAVLAGRYPRLFSSLTAQEAALGADAVAPAHVAGVEWDLWCRNTWLTNSCAVDDLSAVAETTLRSLVPLLSRVAPDNDNNVNEVWSSLHVLAWALRTAPAARPLVAAVTDCGALWELIDREVVKGGRHTSLQLVLLDLLGALALHVSTSSKLFSRLCAVARARAQFPHPVHFHTALRICYACVLCDDEQHSKTQPMLEHLRVAWRTMRAQVSNIPAPLHATEWVVGEGAKAHLDVARQLREQLASRGTGPFDLKALKKFHATVAQLPAEARAFCLYALPGNALLSLLTTMQSPTAAPELVMEVVATLVDDVVGHQRGAAGKPLVVASKADGYVQYCVQQLWMDGLSATLSKLLQRRSPAITAAVVRLLRHLTASSRRGSAVRRVLLGAPSLSLVGDVLSGVAETPDVKSELAKAAVAAVVEEALLLLSAMDNAELTSVFTDSLVFTVSTLVSEGKETASLLRSGLRALARLAAAFPMAGSMVLDFEFLMERCAIPDPPTDASATLVVGSLDLMSAVVSQQPAAVTFEWIELLLGVLQHLASWREGVPGLDVALWRCVQYTVEASEDCYEYLFSEEAQEVLRNELERMKYHDAGYQEVLPSLLNIAVCLQAVEHAEVNAAMAEVLHNVPANEWTPDMCSAALRFIAAAYCADDAKVVAPSRGQKGAADPLASTVASLVLRVIDGAHQSGVEVLPAVLDELAGRLEVSGEAPAVVAGLFGLVDAACGASAETETEKGKPAAATVSSLSHALLPLLHCLVSQCPSARNAATAASAARFLTRTAGEGETNAALDNPDVVAAALLLVNDACAANLDDAGDEVERAKMMAELWPSLGRVTRRAADSSARAGWQRVLGHVFGAAHALLLGSTTAPFGADADPRLDFIGDCGLPHVSLEPCSALVQTVLNYDEARAYLRNKYATAYESSLEYMADPRHNVSGVVPLPVLQYLAEAKQA